MRAAVDLHHGATRRCCSAAPLPPVFSARESDDMLLCPQANSQDHYPEAFWNCADVEIKPEGCVHDDV